MCCILSLSEWFEFVQDFLLDEEKVSPFSEGLEYIFSNLNISDILSNNELNTIINKNQFIDFIINYIDNNLLYLREYNYLSHILKYFLEFWRNHEDLDDFINLKYYLHEFQLNDFTILIQKYNQWLDSQYYVDNITFREQLLVEDYIHLLENWTEWFNIRYKMNNVFVNDSNIDWYIFSTYLSEI